ncbi:MAG: ribosomal protein L13e [Candidatus Bathyarchaeota archaeon]|nr:MAG: ribosomal protein L13e [Candidatus Bathyarchaeota archaeon]
MRERRVEPLVQASGRSHSRRGKGFSVKELQEAGLTIGRARSLGISVDTRRKTSYSENSRILKQEYLITFPLTEIKGVGKSIEEELIHAGIFDARDLAETEIDELSVKLNYSKNRLKKWKTEATKMVKEKLSQ